jgi:hypothetical protein
MVGIALTAMLLGCGSSGSPQDKSEPSGTFPVEVTTATFPSAQTLSQHTRLVIAIRNVGQKTIPDIAVTISDPKYGTSLHAFSQYLNMPGLASHSRPVWIVDKPPGSCTGASGYSCLQGGAGGATSAYANTWALGQLKPGQVARFEWGLTAVAPGLHRIHYVVAAGLNGKAKARLGGGGIPAGTFTVRIASQPSQSYVNNNGQIVSAK